MQFVVESAGVADRLAINIPSPERGLCGLAIGAHRALAPGGGLERERGREEEKKRKERKLMV